MLKKFFITLLLHVMIIANVNIIYADDIDEEETINIQEEILDVSNEMINPTSDSINSSNKANDVSNEMINSTSDGINSSNKASAVSNEINNSLNKSSDVSNEISNASNASNEIISTSNEVKSVSNQIVGEPKIDSRIALIYDRKSGRVLYGKQENKRTAMASTTKILTCLVVLENSNLSDEVVVSAKAAGTGGSRLKLKTGDKITVLNLLYGLMLRSGNDAAVALAEHVGGSVEGFAELMNKKAKELELKNTHFVTPHGLDNPEHYTTALELAKITDCALKNEMFAQIVNTKSCTININNYSQTITNTNELLGVINGVNGVKTGFTNNAGRCLVTSVNRDNMNFITVVIGADTKKIRTADSIKLIEYAYKNYKEVDVEKIVSQKFEAWRLINEKQINIIKGKENYLELVMDDIKIKKIIVKEDEVDKIDIDVKCLSVLEAPVEENRILGQIKVTLNDEIIEIINIKNCKEIQKNDRLDYIKKCLKEFVNYF